MDHRWTRAPLGSRVSLGLRRAERVSGQDDEPRLRMPNARLDKRQDKRWVIAVAAGAEDARSRLLGLGDVATVVGTTPDELLRSRTVLEKARGRGCAWVDGDVARAAEVVRAARSAGVPVVLSSAHPGQDLGAGAPLIVGGPGIGSLALAQLVGKLRSQALGAPRRITVRAPGGRAVRPAASKRSAFGPDGRIAWTLEADAAGRVEALATPLARVLEATMPGAVASLVVSELIGDDGAERLVAHTQVSGVAVTLELDRETRGDEDWELEAVCERGTLLARFRTERGVLLVRAPLRRDETVSGETVSDSRSADELLVRHLLAHPEAPAIGVARELDVAREGVRSALRDASAGAHARPVGLVLVHVPRYRNAYDELMIPSLALARLAAYVRGYGYEVGVADLEAEHAPLPLEAFTDDARVDRWLAGEPDRDLDAPLDAMWPSIERALSKGAVVGFSIVDYFGHFQMNLASCLARLVKQRGGHTTVLGGERDQVDGDRALASDIFDYVVDGDGEDALLAIVEHEAYGQRDPRSVRGIWTRDGDALIKNRLVRSHLNAMPRPDFDGVPLERYRRAPSAALLEALRADGLAPEKPPAPFLYLPYAFVKGCVAECSFCSAKEHLDVQAPEKTVDELLALSERHGVKDFVFLDNLVNLSPKWLRKFCERLIAANADLQWTDSCRPTGIDAELAGLMRASGCLLLNYGAESGSDAVLDRMKKGLHRADIVETLRATHAAGIVNRVNLIAGYFHETEADVDLTISLVEELADPIDVIGCFQGFYLFDGMGVDPEAEGIVLRESHDRLRTGQATLAYDEIGGLRWEEKRDRIDASRNRILARIEELGIRTIDKIDEYDLFWLSRTFRDKAITTRYVLQVPSPETARVNRAALLPGGVSGRTDARSG